MSRLVARIMLAILMLPLVVLIYVPLLIMLMEVFSLSESYCFGIANVVAGVFVVGYWVLLWRGTIRWTPERSGLTAGASVACVIIGIVVGALGTTVDPSFGIFLAGPTIVVSWLVATVLVWRETPGERSERLKQRGASAIACPACGYNLTGLRTTSCPECGADYSLDELLAGQPARESEELAG